MPDEMKNAVIAEFPLRGIWEAPNTPGKVIPSHGTDLLGQRYAYDFYQIVPGKKGVFYKGSALKYFTLGVRLDECLSWGSVIHSPLSGRVVTAEDGYPERQRVNFFTDMFVVLKNALFFDPAKSGLKPVVGNHVIIDCGGNVFAFFAHMQRGSVCVTEGQEVKKGQAIGRLGHSGNSTAPHLHFHLMDRADLMTAKGIPCAFECCDTDDGTGWKTEENCVPNDKVKIRYAGIN